MYYIGKSIDTFSAAFAQMIESSNVEQVPFLDCISLRCFGFQMGTNIKDWFSPIVSIPQSVTRISEVTGLSLDLQILDRDSLSSVGQKGAVLGPLPTGNVAVQELRDFYYQGAGDFLFCKSLGEGIFELCDPRGFAGLRICEKQLSLILPEKMMFCIWIRDANQTQCVPAHILEFGLRYHMQIKDEEYAQMAVATQSYTPDRKSTISLHYATMNLLLQLDKVFFLAHECGILTRKKNERYLSEKQALYALTQQKTISALPEIIDRIWSILEHGA